MEKKTGSFKSLLGLYKPYKKSLVIACLGSLLLSITVLIYPLITKYVIEDLSTQSIQLAKGHIIGIGTLITILIILEGIGRYIQNVQWSITVDKIIYGLQTKLYNHFCHMSFSWYDNNKTGEMLAIIDGDTDKLDIAIYHLPTYILQNFITIIGACITFSTLSWKLLLVIIPIIPMIAIFEYFYPSKIIRPITTKVREANREKFCLAEDRISGVRTITSFSTQDREVEKFNNKNDEIIEKSKHKWRRVFIHYYGTSGLITMVWFFILTVGSWWMVNGEVSIADISLFLMNSYLITNPIRDLSDMIRDCNESLVSWKKICDVLSTESEIKNIENCVSIDKNIHGAISFNNVSFMYDSKEENQVLNNFSIDIKAGEYVALVGSSGCGKSTIANLIPRFYDANSGTITIDGINIKDIDLYSLRRNIGMVQQDIYLFNGTVYDNIKYACPEVTMEQVIDAAKKANAHEFITNLPKGYNSDIGEKGVKLSGGQKQRIAIARIFLLNPSIVIFDEATSALDNISEKKVQKALEQLSKHRTTVVIAHRLTTIKNADRIIYLEANGTIIEEGNHNHLMSLNGNYAKLYKMNKM